VQAIAKKRETAKRTKKSAPASAFPAPSELAEGMWERISAKAYQLWEERGRRDGHDLEDWYDAEGIVLQEIHESRE